ncbi:MAG: aminotransferase class I/II-fold pyridoxal phosphate-dependent enzyme, partial [Polyangiales bacterium]
VSTAEVYGPRVAPRGSEGSPRAPATHAGCAALAAEALVESEARGRRAEWVIARMGEVYDGGDDAVGRAITAALAGDEIEDVDHDLVHLDDAVAALSRALERRMVGAVNVSGGDPRSLREVSAVVAVITGRSPPAVDARERGGLDVTRAREHLGVTPTTSLEEGVRRALVARGHRVDHAPRRVGPAPTVRLARPSVGAFEVDTAVGVLLSGWLADGRENRAFEYLLQEHLRAEAQPLTVNSCASALFVALRALDVRGEVIVPAFTFAATANAVVAAGATPRFVDIEPGSFGLDPARVERAITDRTRAIVAVHLAGVACQVEALRAIALRHGLVLIEDVAQALGAAVRGRAVGTFGDAGCFSFFPTKTLTTGEGGAVLFRDPAARARAAALSAHGVSREASEAPRHPWERRVISEGHNLRMSAVAAAVGYAQLHRLPSMNARRRAVAARYREALPPSLVALTPPPGSECVWSTFPIRVPPGARVAFIAALASRGVEASVHYDRPVPFEPWYRERFGHAEGEFPVAERVAAEVVSIPMHADLLPREVEQVIDAVRAALDETAR